MTETRNADEAAAFPYQDADVADVLARLVNNKDLLSMLAAWRAPRLAKLFPGALQWMLKQRLQGRIVGVRTIAGFQDIMARYVSQLIDSSMTSFEVEGFELLDPALSYLFISNHRDIAGDSMLLNYALHQRGMGTVQIAVGDNLVQQSFATDLMRLNKSFFINRTGDNPRTIYRSLAGSSRYIRESLASGNSVWLAQSEGRAKDGWDRTDTAVLKMLHLSDRKQPFGTSLAALRIVPMSLSYEFDPCDEAKARELTAIARDGAYVKAPGEDLMSLVNGLTGFKGRVVLRVGPVYTPSPDAEPEEVAHDLDRQIMSRYAIQPINRAAVNAVNESGDGNDAEGDAALADRQSSCDPAYHDALIRMYANPVLNRADLDVSG